MFALTDWWWTLRRLNLRYEIFLYASICNSNQAVFVWSLICSKQGLPVMAHNFCARCWWMFPQTTLVDWTETVVQHVNVPFECNYIGNTFLAPWTHQMKRGNKKEGDVAVGKPIEFQKWKGNSLLWSVNALSNAKAICPLDLTIFVHAWKSLRS